MQPITLTRFLIEQQRRDDGTCPAELRLLIETVARACKTITFAIAKGALGDVLGALGSENVQGEVQKKLDVIANEILLDANEWGGPDNISVVAVAVNRVPEDRAPPPWALPLEGGEPVVLAMGQEDESVHTQVIEPGKPRSFWYRWRDLIFLIVYVALLLFVLLFNNR